MLETHRLHSTRLREGFGGWGRPREVSKVGVLGRVAATMSEQGQVKLGVENSNWGMLTLKPSTVTDTLLYFLFIFYATAFSFIFSLYFLISYYFKLKDECNLVCRVLTFQTKR